MSWVQFRLFLLGLLSFQFGIAQKTTELQEFNQSFGYGTSNVLSLVTDPDYRPEFYLSYSMKKDDGFFYNGAVSFSYKTYKNGTIRNHELIPLTVLLGIEKLYYHNNFFGGFGADFFFTMSVRSSSISSFQLDDYGVGVAPLLSGGYALTESLSLRVKYQIGVGLFRNFQGVGFVAQQTLETKLFSPRNLSFGIEHYF